MSKSFRELVEAINARKPPMHGKVGGPPKAKGEEEFADENEYPVTTGGKDDTASPFKNADNVLNARKAKQTSNLSNKVPGERSKINQGSSEVKQLAGFKGSQTPPNHGDTRDGDKKPVRTSKSAVSSVTEETEDLDELSNKKLKSYSKKASRELDTAKTFVNQMLGKNTRRINKRIDGVSLANRKIKEETDLTEDVTSELGKIAKSGKSGQVTFGDGDKTNVNASTAKKMMETYNKLNPDNARKFRDTINGSAAGFLRMMKFSDKGSK